MISVVIPSYKNKKMLIDNLNNNIKFLEELEIIIINDSPDESLKKDLAGFKVILIENDKNLGFGPSVNKGIIKAKNKYVLLLNTDVRLKNQNYINALKYFKENKKLFAVAFAQKDKNGLIVGKNKVYWKYGFFRHKENTDLSFEINAWVEGGASIVDRDIFLKLGGFDDLYSPFYWEDIDLSYRAWRSGYEIFFDPKIIMRHYHESTISKYFQKKYIEKIAFRNQLIFIWKNITDFNLILHHIFFLIPNLIIFTLKGKFNYLMGFFGTVKNVSTIIKNRKKQKSQYILKDSEVLQKFK
jgi:GT2 family glycosyltransferase